MEKVSGNKIKKIAFIDSVRQAKRLSQMRGKGCADIRNGGLLAVSMEPAVYLWLKRSGFEAVDTTAYFTVESHKAVSRKADEVVKWMEGRIRFNDMGIDGISNAHKTTFLFYARLVVVHCLWCVEIINNAIKAHSPDTIIGASRGIGSSGVYVTAEECFFGIIAEKSAVKNGLEYCNINMINPVTRADYWYGGTVFRFIIRYLDFCIWRSRLSKRMKKRSRGPIMAASGQYGMGRIMVSLRQCLGQEVYEVLKGPVIPRGAALTGLFAKILWPDKLSYIKEQRGIFREFTGEMSGADDVFSYGGIDFGALVSDKFHRSIFDYMIGDMLWTTMLDDFIKEVRPCVFISSGDRIDETAIAELGTKRGVKTVLVSHGSLTPVKNEYERIEWGEQGRTLTRIPCSHVASQSPMAERYFETFPVRGAVVRTGPLIWGGVVPGNRRDAIFHHYFKDMDVSKTKVVVHAGSPKENKSLRPYIYETSDEYIRALKDIADVIRGKPNIALIIRMRSTREISPGLVKSFFPDEQNIAVSTDGSFLDVLAAADLLVSFSSTTIEEALQNYVPVLLYGGSGRYEHVPARIIEGYGNTDRAAVYHVRDKLFLEQAIEGVLSLNIDKGRDSGLFSPYRYREDERTDFPDFVRSILSE